MYEICATFGLEVHYLFCLFTYFILCPNILVTHKKKSENKFLKDFKENSFKQTWWTQIYPLLTAVASNICY